MKKKRLRIIGLIAAIAIILFIGIKFVLSKEQTDPKDYYQIVDKDFDKIVDVPFTKVSSFRGNKDLVYMSVADKSRSGKANKIIQYNRNTQEYTTIFESKFKNPSVEGIEINDNWMVWVDCDEWDWYVNPYVMNLDTKEIQPLAKEKDDNFRNGLPILIGNYVAWIQKDVQKEGASIMLKNLQTNETEIIFDFNTYTFRNMRLSATEGKLLFTDEKNKSGSATDGNLLITDEIIKFGYLYLYDVISKELKEVQSPYEEIGWAKFINDQQLVYLTFNEASSDTQKLIFYDSSSNSTQEVLSDINGFRILEKDSQNQLYVGYNENDYLEKYSVDNNNLVQVEKLMGSKLGYDDFSANNGIYLVHEDFDHQEDNKQKKIIIQNELTN